MWARAEDVQELRYITRTPNDISHNLSAWEVCKTRSKVVPWENKAMSYDPRPDQEARRRNFWRWLQDWWRAL